MMSDRGSCRCMIADDEPAVRAHVAALATDAGLDVVAQATNGDEALRLAESLKPEILFLDIRMPGPSGLDVLHALSRSPRPPVVVLVTAYDRYAVTAFSLAAVDFVLKPVDPDRFRASVERARETVESRAASQVLAGLEEILSKDRPQCIAFRDRGVQHRFPLRDVECFQAMGDFVEVCAGRHRWLLSTTLESLGAVLPHPPFLRVHRSHIVNVDHVASHRYLDGGRMTIEMKNGARVTVSRGRAATVRAALSGGDGLLRI